MRTLIFVVLGSSLYAANAGAQAPRPDAEVFFGSDSSILDDSDMARLDTVAEHAKDAPGTRVILDAHADPRGTAPYNVGLSIRRAKSVREALTRRGVDADRIVLAAYGEDGAKRKTFAQDRRVSVTLTAEPLYGIIDGSGNATTVVWNEPVTYAEMHGPSNKIERTARR